MLIKEYFNGQEIFITGGSGFVGKALIEKLVRSCPGFSKIYVLLRPKKNKSESERLNEILQENFFERARTEQPQCFQRIEAISGDCKEIGLGISSDGLKRMENVNIIYHSAASVRFDDPLRDAILLNARGTWELLKIAESLKKLQVFLHVSTAFCNSQFPIIEEKVYTPCADWRQTIKIAEAVDKETLNIFNFKYHEFKPNTYIFTKALAEQILDDYKHKVPVVIYRPAVVTNCLGDPYPGWIDNFNGPMGMLTACGIGINKYHNSRGDSRHPIVPIDIVVRGMIIASYKMGLQVIKKESVDESKTVDVYNCSIDKVSPISLKDLVEFGRIEILRNPYEKTVWLPGGAWHACPFMFYFKLFTVQLMMALVVDSLLCLFGQKPMLIKLQRRICVALVALKVFVCNEWEFKAEKFFSLEKCVPVIERDEFSFLEKSQNIDFEQYVCAGIKGIKQFLLKEDRESSPGARKRLQILKVVHYTLEVLIYVYILRIVFLYLYRFIA